MLQELCKQGILNFKRISEFNFCETSVMGKSQRLQFAPLMHKTKDILEYIQSDLWGSPQVPLSLLGAQYFISFADDYSKKVWVYFLK